MSRMSRVGVDWRTADRARDRHVEIAEVDRIARPEARLGHMKR
jgi:hypothetical protein